MRYIILVLLNLPIVLLAILNLVTKLKMKKITTKRFRGQVIFWILLFIVIVVSFPMYNLLMGRPALESDKLTFFDIVQTTAIVYLLYVVVNQRLKVGSLETRLRDLHQETSILFSKED